MELFRMSELDMRRNICGWELLNMTPKMAHATTFSILESFTDSREPTFEDEKEIKKIEHHNQYNIYSYHNTVLIQVITRSALLC